MYAPPPPAYRPKPSTVRTVEVLVAVKAGLLLSAVGMLLLGVGITLFSSSDSGGRDLAWNLATLVILAPVGAFYLAVAVNIGKGRVWAWVSTLVLESLSVMGGLATLVGARYDNAMIGIGLSMSVAALACAASSSAREYFRPSPRPWNGSGA